MNRYKPTLFLFVFCLFHFGCRSTPEPNSQTYRVICDERLAEVITPLLPEVENTFGAVQVDYIPESDAQLHILEGTADAWFTLENTLGLDYLLRMYNREFDKSAPNFFSLRLNPGIQPGETLLMYEIFQLGNKESHFGEWVNALKSAGLDDRLVQQGIVYPVWEKGKEDELAFLSSIVIDELNFKSADLKDIILEVWQRANALTPDVPLPDIRFDFLDETSPTTLKLRNVTVMDALKTITEISGLYFKMDGDEIVIYRMGPEDGIRIVYALPPEKVIKYLDEFNEKHMSSSGIPIPHSLRALSETSLSEMQKLQFCTSVYGISDVTIKDFETEYGFILVEGLGADQPAFKQFLRQIYFHPVSFEEVTW